MERQSPQLSSTAVKDFVNFCQKEKRQKQEEESSLTSHEKLSRGLYDRAESLLMTFGEQKKEDLETTRELPLIDIFLSRVIAYSITPPVPMRIDGRDISFTINNKPVINKSTNDKNSIHLEADLDGEKRDLFVISPKNEETKNWLGLRATFEQMAGAEELLSGIKESLEKGLEKTPIFELSGHLKNTTA